jgi:hypothetical protein
MGSQRARARAVDSVPIQIQKATELIQARPCLRA